MWTARVEGGPCCSQHAAVAIGEDVYSFGGYCAEEINTTRRPMDVHILNTGSLRWTLVPVQSNLENVPFQRFGHTVVGYGEYAYLWGGRNEDGACSIVYRFDTESLTWLRPRTTGETPAAREGHSACVVGSRMYVFGGVDDEADRLSQDVHVLDLDTMHWRFLATRGSAPEWRSFHTAVAIGRRMYVWGGRRSSTDLQDEVAYCDRLAYLDTTNGAWVHPVTKGMTPLGRCSHAAFVYKGEVYVFGGYNGLLETFFGDMYKYSPECSQWSPVKLLRRGPSARRGHRCCVVGDRLFLFGGTSPVSSKGNVVEGYRHSSETASLMEQPDLHILDFAPSLKTLCLLVLIDYCMDISDLPDENKWEISCMTSKNSASSPRVCC